ILSPLLETPRPLVDTPPRAPRFNSSQRVQRSSTRRNTYNGWKNSQMRVPQHLGCSPHSTPLIRIRPARPGRFPSRANLDVYIVRRYTPAHAETNAADTF